MTKRILLFCTLLMCTLITQAQLSIPDLAPAPSVNPIIIHDHYTLSYSEKHEQAEWVYYYLTPERIKGSVKRTDHFREDPGVLTGSAQLSDYKGSGYDRGHLCPAADNKQSISAMDQSFYMSNMSPQAPSFNRGLWKKLEEQFRSWVLEKGGLYVITAGVLSDQLATIGKNQVSVPQYYYKMAYNPHAQQMVAFLMANSKLAGPITDYVVTVDSVEAVTGLDFFPGLSDGLEDKLESDFDLAAWELFNAKQ
ncbi:MAG: DNA/RNA non-specific endonuclease [Cyclobacteriaceae bacterium]|nr:DNA/RNA non-specific endonuclease [Cyclobacteriaceae bacterium]